MPNILSHSSSQTSETPILCCCHILPFTERNKSPVLLTWHLTLFLSVPSPCAGSPNPCLGTSKDRKQFPKRALSSGIHFLCVSSGALLSPEPGQSSALCETFPQAGRGCASNPAAIKCTQLHNEYFLIFEVPLPWKSLWINEKTESKPHHARESKAEQAKPVPISRQAPVCVDTELFRAVKLLEVLVSVIL